MSVRCAKTSDQNPKPGRGPAWIHYMIITPTLICHLRLEEGLAPNCHYLASASVEPTSEGWGDMTPGEILAWKAREHGAASSDLHKIGRLMVALQRKRPDLAEQMNKAIHASQTEVAS